MKGKFLWLIVALAAMVSLIGYPAYAVTLTDMNSSVSINPVSQAGMNSWYVDGQSQLYQQWFWYRVGASGPESSIDTLTLVTSESTSRSATFYYAGNGFTVDITYTLTGGSAGSFMSDIDESIRIINTSRTSLDFSFFQYSDFDLNGNSGDTVQLVNSNTVRQFDPQATLSETVVTPAASYYELANFATTLDKLNDVNPTTLASGATTVGPGDVTWAFQWDRTIGAGGTLLISKDKRIAPVPEPFTVLLLGLGLVGLAGVRRFRK